MKNVELPPPPLFPYQFSRLLLPPRTLSNILHFHGRHGTVFPPLSSTVDPRQLKPSGKSRSKVNGTTFASRKLSPSPPPPPEIPPHLRRTWVNLLTKLASHFFTVKIFITSHFSAPFFNKIKSEKLSERVYRFKVLLFIKYIKKNRKLLATLIIFSFFLLKWNYGKLSDRYAIFLFFHFLNKMEKMKKWCEEI